MVGGGLVGWIQQIQQIQQQHYLQKVWLSKYYIIFYMMFTESTFRKKVL